jgi:glyoxylase-like metal-dependent hydrolase (beta-lactamase superfamily II)
MNRNRRRFLQLLGGAGVAAVGLGRSAPVHSADEPLATTDLGDGLVQIMGAGGNIVVLPGADGLVMVDSGTAASSQRVLELITKELGGGANVRALFNTHWHLDHTGGNDAIAERDVSIVAHENTRLWMSTQFYVDWEDRRYRPRAAAALPNKTFFSSDPQPQNLSFDGEEIVYGHLREAHTDGDIYVRFAKRNVIVAGGVVTAWRYPILDYITGGWIGGLVDATQQLIDMADDATRFVPDAGPVQRRADVEMHLQMLSTVRERMEAMALEGRGIDDMIDAGLTKDFDGQYTGDSALFIANAYEGMWWRMRGTVA